MIDISGLSYDERKKVLSRELYEARLRERELQMRNDINKLEELRIQIEYIRTLIKHNELERITEEKEGKRL